MHAVHSSLIVIFRTECMHMNILVCMNSHTHIQDVQLKASSLITVAQPALPPAPTLTPSVHCSVYLAVSVPGRRCLIRGRRSVSFPFGAPIEPIRYSSATITYVHVRIIASLIDRVVAS